MDTITRDKHTIKEHRFETNDGHHKLYAQEWGSKDGAPILYLHGGPGSGCNDGNKQYFDPTKHKVIFLDQRGSGHSQPYGSLKENTTQKLIEDIELVRDKLGIHDWTVTGRSWGSTLALCYGIEHIDRVRKMIIGGVVLGSREEIEWLEKAEFRRFFPEVEEESKITPYTYVKLAIPTLKLDDRYKIPDEQDFDEKPAKIELHYTKNNCYLSDGFILQNAHKINVPVDIVQGRYDMMTPPMTAYKLHQKLPNSNLHWTIAGHSGSDRANYDITKTLLSQVG